jgi:hypothetical protein
MREKQRVCMKIRAVHLAKDLSTKKAHHVQCASSLGICDDCSILNSKQTLEFVRNSSSKYLLLMTLTT